MVEREVDAKPLLEGDFVNVPLGAKIPTDETVEFVSSERDESALTTSLCLCPRNRVTERERHLEPSGTTRVRLSGVSEKSAVAQIAKAF